MDYPKLRQVEVVPIENGTIYIKDPLGYSDKILFLSHEVAFVCSLFDGKHSVLDIQSEFTRHYGVVIFSEKIKEIIQQMDNYLFLENQHFYTERERLITEFKSLKVRPPKHSGQAYDADPEECRLKLDSYFRHSNGPGMPDTPLADGRLSGLIAPHIDIDRGGLCFAYSYAALFQECQADIFVILGIAHSPTAKTYALTNKDFKTPFGVVLCNREITEKINKMCSTDFFTDEYVHKHEHSVEFQTLFLKYLYPEKEITILPVLCSSMIESTIRGSSPYEDEHIREFIDALTTIVKEYGEKLCVIAGVDFSHIGRRFGQDITISKEILRDLESTDKSYIDTILSGNGEDFMELVYKRKNNTNVCGVPALYTFLKITDHKKSKLLMYDQAVDKTNHSVVSFAGAAFFKE